MSAYALTQEDLLEDIEQLKLERDTALLTLYTPQLQQLYTLRAELNKLQLWLEAEQARHPPPPVAEEVELPEIIIEPPPRPEWQIDGESWLAQGHESWEQRMFDQSPFKEWINFPWHL